MSNWLKKLQIKGKPGWAETLDCWVSCSLKDTVKYIYINMHMYAYIIHTYTIIYCISTSSSQKILLSR